MGLVTYVIVDLVILRTCIIEFRWIKTGFRAMHKNKAPYRNSEGSLINLLLVLQMLLSALIGYFSCQ